MPRYGLCVDVSRCIGCYSCTVGCKNWNRIEPGDPERIRIIDVTSGEYPHVSKWILPLTCMHCDHPPCVSVCRFGASYKREDGIVAIHPDRCVGCRLCVFACPYGARKMKQTRNVADGCNLCAEDIDEGKIPYCVESCPTEALIFGDLNDPKSAIRGVLTAERTETLLPDCRTRPKVFYANLGPAEDLKGDFFSK